MSLGRRTLVVTLATAMLTGAGCESRVETVPALRADAGPDLRVRAGERVTIVGRAEGTDTPGFVWTLVSPSSAPGLAAGASAELTYVAPAGGLYVFSLVVTDGEHRSPPDYMNLMVSDCVDGDGDGYLPVGCGGDDCDDVQAAINPGQAERCVVGGVDDDCDGFTDCDDSECAQAPACGCAAREAACSDGADDDCDGDTDCADAECDTVACGANGLVCTGGACACPTGTSETACTDGIDDDCDGDTDCADTECDAASCGAFGRVCASGVCACPGGEATEASCDDGVDNDCDGDTDCADANCAGVTPCGCAGAEAACDDSADNDCDGDTDCADADCDDAACGANGQLCQAGACACPGPGTETACGDGIDEDCDGDTDCGDSNCDTLSCGANGQVCATGSCACPGGEPSEATCDDGVDNDCDGDTDCADAACDLLACGANGEVCTGGSCACPGPGTESVCDDGVDEDCDGNTDCADPDCDTGTCGPNGEVCSGGVCQCPGPGAETACDDGVDEDCDGTTDCEDGECDGAACGANGRECAVGLCVCPGPADETDCADGLDEDCDGSTDCADAGCDALACGIDGEVCTGGSCACPGPGAETACSDGVDEDCDGTTDCSDPDCASDIACCTPTEGTESSCSDGIDNDCDGAIDTDDTDCWWDASWDHRVRITFDNSAQSQDLDSFPVLVTFTGSPVSYTDTMDAGEDLRFVDADGTTVLDHEIELWDESGTSAVWVRVPRIQGGSSADHIWLYFGNASASDGQSTTGVWQNGYRAVLHLSEVSSDETSASLYADSTGNGNTGTQNNNASAVAGIGRCQDFDGIDDWIQIDQSGLQITGQAITLEARALIRTESNSFPHVLGGGSSGRYWQLSWDTAAGWWGRLRIAGGSQDVWTTAGTLNQWASLALVYDGSEVRLFLDGQQIGTPNPASGNLDALNTVLQIGHNPNLNPRDFDGLIDEVRISDVSRSADWLAAQHLSQTGAFTSWGVVENR